MREKNCNWGTWVSGIWGMGDSEERDLLVYRENMRKDTIEEVYQQLKRKRHRCHFA